MKHLRLWMMLLVAIGGAVLFACGGDSDDDDNGSNNEPTAAATSDGGATGDTDSELRELAARMGDEESKVVYTFTSSAGGTESTGSFTLFWKPPDRWRLDIDMGLGGSVSTVIEKEGTTYICSGDGSGGGSCFASPTALPLPFLGLFTDPGSLADLIDTEAGGIDFDKSTKTIAGQDVDCYTGAGSVEGQTGSAEYCFNDNGRLVRLDGGSDAGGSFTLEATSVESSVADADVELPYDIVEIPGQ